MENKVRALRYPLFCLGHALHRLWNPKPQFLNLSSNESHSRGSRAKNYMLRTAIIKLNKMQKSDNIYP